MSERHTVNTITSDALDALYESLDAAQTTELYRQLRSADAAFASASVRAAKAEAAVDRARKLHRRNEHTGDCEHCSEHDYPNYAVPSPCPTTRALDQPAPKDTP